MSGFTSSIQHRRLSVVCVVAVGGLLGLSGCSGQPSNSAKNTSTNGESELSPAQCDELIGNVVVSVQPERLGISADAGDCVELLNGWQEGCAGNTGGPADSQTALQEFIDRFLPPEQRELVRSKRFSERDVRHFRDSLIFQQTLDFALEGATDDLERVSRLFEYVNRNVGIRSASDSLPLSPYEIMMFGRGTAQDRAWIFGGLLRQLRIDAVIVRPLAGDSDADGGQPDDGPCLIGVILDDETFLFDTQLGWPIPSAEDDGREIVCRAPATLAEVRADDALLRRLDADEEHPYPLKSADFERVSVELIGQTSLWAPRCRELQQSLTGERSVVIYESLADGEFGQGLVGRVVEAGGDAWSEQDVSIWPYPEERLDAMQHLDRNQETKLAVMWQPYKAPHGHTIDAGTNQIVMESEPEWRQKKTRTSQILGDFEKAVGSYVTIQLEAPPPGYPLPPEIHKMHNRAAEDARFWSGVCQFEQGQFQSAESTFRDYLNRYGRNEGGNPGPWFTECFDLRARCFARDGGYAAAVQILNQALKQIPADDPRHATFQLLADRWRNIRDANEPGM